MSRVSVALVAAMLLAGPAACENPFGGCEERTQIVEVVWGDSFEEVREAMLARLKADGWKCHSEAIRNAFGTEIGVKHTCTICD